MTPRENLLATLAGRRRAWMPAGVHIANENNLPASLPEALLAPPLDRLAISRFIGGDIVYEYRAVGVAPAAGFHRRHEEHGRRRRTTLVTPGGDLVEETVRAAAAGPPPGPLPAGHARPGPVFSSAHTRYFISGPDDYRRLAAYCAGLTFTADSRQAAAEEARVGDGGLAVLGGGPSSPLYALTAAWAGLERLTYDLCDAPAAVEEAMDALLEAGRRWYRAAAATPCTAIRCTEDLDTSLTSPALFRRWAAPALAEYARICHDQGKIFIVHMCGRISRLLEAVRDSGADAVHCLTCPPTGDTTLTAARAVLAGRTAAMVRVDPELLLHGSRQRLDDWARRLREEAGDWPGVMVLIPCGRAPLENIRHVIDRVRGPRAPVTAPDNGHREKKR